MLCYNKSNKIIPTKGVYQYAVRHHSEDTEKPTQITDWAVVNRFGSLLSSIPIPMEKVPGSYVKKRDVDADKDWQWNGYSVKLREYLEQYPVPKPPKRQNHER